jgi:hypothetical protein
MTTLIVDHWEATTFLSGGVRITFDAPDSFRASGDVIQAIMNQNTGCLELTWQDGTFVEFLDGSDIDISGGLEIYWTSDDLLRGSTLKAACSLHW